jgi:hypothetical protein
MVFEAFLRLVIFILTIKAAFVQKPNKDMAQT